MQEQATREASDLLYSHWMAGTRIAALPQGIRPRTRAEGYAIQAHLDERTAQPLFGWKIAATSTAGQAHIAVDGPLAGRILAERVIPAGGVCPYGANQMKVAEFEFAFRMGRTLPARGEPYVVAEVLDAVASLHPAIEIPDSRLSPFEEAGAPQLIADNACAHYFMLGEATAADWRIVDLADHRVVGKVNGDASEGLGRNVLEDPRIALRWLVNELSRHGIALSANAVVTTGTCVIPMTMAPGDRIEGDFGTLGQVSVLMARDA